MNGMRAIHPGEILRDALDELKLSANAFAKALDVPVSSGMAAALAGVGRVEFLLELHRYGVAVIDLNQNELEQDVANA